MTDRETVPPRSTSVNQWLYRGYFLEPVRLKPSCITRKPPWLVVISLHGYPCSCLCDLEAALIEEPLFALQLFSTFITSGRGFVNLGTFRSFLSLVSFIYIFDLVCFPYFHRLDAWVPGCVCWGVVFYFISSQKARASCVSKSCNLWGVGDEEEGSL